MAKKYFVYNGIPTEFPYSSGKKWEKFIADNEHLVGCEVSEAEHAAAKKAAEPVDYVHAIMQQMNQDRLQGKEMVQEMDQALAHWLSKQ